MPQRIKGPEPEAQAFAGPGCEAQAPRPPAPRGSEVALQRPRPRSLEPSGLEGRRVAPRLQPGVLEGFRRPVARYPRRLCRAAQDRLLEAGLSSQKGGPRPPQHTCARGSGHRSQQPPPRPHGPETGDLRALCAAPGATPAHAAKTDRSRNSERSLPGQGTGQAAPGDIWGGQSGAEIPDAKAGGQGREEGGLQGTQAGVGLVSCSH